jgi:hypothetical protein
MPFSEEISMVIFEAFFGRIHVNFGRIHVNFRRIHVNFASIIGGIFHVFADCGGLLANARLLAKPVCDLNCETWSIRQVY